MRYDIYIRSTTDEEKWFAERFRCTAGGRARCALAVANLSRRIVQKARWRAHATTQTFTTSPVHAPRACARGVREVCVEVYSKKIEHPQQHGTTRHVRQVAAAASSQFASLDENTLQQHRTDVQQRCCCRRCDRRGCTYMAADHYLEKVIR